MSAPLDASRRRWLGTAAATLSVGILSACALPVIPKRPRPDARVALGWVRHAEGRFTFCLPRAELGQNILTALKQVACEELGVAWDQVEARLHDTDAIERVRATVGSDSVKDFALPLAQACATLRDALARGEHTGHLDPVAHPPERLRSMSSSRPMRHVGRSPRIEQGEAIVTGGALYAADVRRPGMRHGRVLRAPASPALPSRLTGLDEAAARAVPGFVALVRDPLLRQGEAQGVGIVALTPGALDRIEAALAARWRVDGGFSAADIDAALDIDRRLARSTRRDHQVHDDPIDEAGPWDVDLRVDVPLAAHAALEPRAAVADLDAAGHLSVWVGSQDVFYQRDVLCKRLGLDEAQVTVHGCRVGGGFGGKTLCTVELEAAVLARAVRAPVKVQWTRAQEFRQGFHRPPSSHRIRARVKDGRITQWWHAFASSHILFTNAAVPPWLQRLTDVIGDDGVARGSALPYRAEARRTGFDLVRLPVLTGPWRGLGAGPNGFAIESAVDECARRAGADPLQFRLAHAEHPRLARVLRAVGRASRWGEVRAAAPGDAWRHGRGVAAGTYKGMSHAAVVADVAVDMRTGRVRVTHLTCAHDCGRVIHPDQVRAQCEGNLVWGLGMALVERLAVADGQVTAGNFGESPVPRLPEVPPMTVVLVDEGEAPTGAGETAIVAAAAAIINAVRDAVGWRPTRLPLRPEDLMHHGGLRPKAP
jgi:isoquinoline 1-oxidoreductase beta subunit